MTQFYLTPARESEAQALPDAEVFYLSQQDFIRCGDGSVQADMMQNAMDGGFSNFQAAADLAGWYWWSCFPGCLPEGDPCGPFDTEALAIADAQDGADSFTDGCVGYRGPEGGAS